MKGYTTHGSIRGCCGHMHATEQSAQACLERDKAGCASQRGYSDRSIAIVGDDGLLYQDPECENWIPGDGGPSCGAARFAN